MRNIYTSTTPEEVHGFSDIKNFFRTIIDAFNEVGGADSFPLAIQELLYYFRIS